MNTVKEYVQIYPLEQFPLLKDFCDNLHSYSKGKNEYWESFLRSSLKHGLQIVCRILNNHMHEAYVSLAGGPEYNLYYLGTSSINSEDDIVKMLENFSDDIFNIDIDEWDKERMQKFFISELLSGDLSVEK